MNFQKKRLLSICVCLVLLPAMAVANPEASASGKLIFAVNEGAIVQEVAIKLITEIYKNLKVEIEVVPKPPPRATSLNLNKKVAGEVARIFEYREKNPSLIRVEPGFYYIRTALYCLKDSKIEIKTPDQLAKFHVTLVRGSTHAEKLESHMSRITKVDSPIQMYEMLSHHRLDILIDTEISGRVMLRKPEFANLRQCGILGKQDLYHILNESSQHLGSKVSAEIKRLQANGKLDRMIKDAEKSLGY